MTDERMAAIRAALDQRERAEMAWFDILDGGYDDHEKPRVEALRLEAERTDAAFWTLLSEPEPRAISEAEVEAGAKALRRFLGDDDPVVTQRWTDQARTVLTAAADAARTGVKNDSND